VADSPLQEKGRLRREIGAAKDRQARVLLDVEDRLPLGSNEGDLRRDLELYDALDLAATARRLGRGSLPERLGRPLAQPSHL
jgi:hypothetical protein